MTVIAITVADSILYILCGNVYLQYQILAYKIISVVKETAYSHIKQNLAIIDNEILMKNMVSIIRRHDHLIQLVCFINSRLI